MSQPSVRISFRQEVVDLPLESLTALKETTPRELNSRTYKQLRASLEHVGLIEPLAVFPRDKDRFLVVNGNLRLLILRQLGFTSARCTVALDDESYTYNKRVNALSPVTEHFMILKAIANGVTEERIAEGLNIDVRAIRNRRNLLDGICPEVVELLKERRVSSRTFAYLRKMKPLRQIEATELMISGKNYTVSFAAAILGVTNEEQLVKPMKNIVKSSGSRSTSLLEETTDNLVSDLALAKRTYGSDVLALTVVCRSVENLLANAEVGKYLRQNHPTVLDELKQVVTEVSTERTNDLQNILRPTA
jgi:RepB plasmid partitioning protein/ParB-like nuclease domain